MMSIGSPLLRVDESSSAGGCTQLTLGSLRSTAQPLRSAAPNPALSDPHPAKKNMAVGLACVSA